MCYIITIFTHKYANFTQTHTHNENICAVAGIRVWFSVHYFHTLAGHIITSYITYRLARIAPRNASIVRYIYIYIIAASIPGVLANLQWMRQLPGSIGPTDSCRPTRIRFRLRKLSRPQRHSQVTYIEREHICKTAPSVRNKTDKMYISLHTTAANRA